MQVPLSTLLLRQQRPFFAEHAAPETFSARRSKRLADSFLHSLQVLPSVLSVLWRHPFVTYAAPQAAYAQNQEQDTHRNRTCRDTSDDVVLGLRLFSEFFALESDRASMCVYWSALQVFPLDLFALDVCSWVASTRGSFDVFQRKFLLELVYVYLGDTC